MNQFAPGGEGPFTALTDADRALIRRIEASRELGALCDLGCVCPTELMTLLEARSTTDYMYILLLAGVPESEIRATINLHRPTPALPSITELGDHFGCPVENTGGGIVRLELNPGFINVEATPGGYQVTKMAPGDTTRQREYCATESLIQTLEGILGAPA